MLLDFSSTIRQLTLVQPAKQTQYHFNSILMKSLVFQPNKQGQYHIFFWQVRLGIVKPQRLAYEPNLTLLLEFSSTIRKLTFVYTGKQTQYHFNSILIKSLVFQPNNHSQYHIFLGTKGSFAVCLPATIPDHIVRCLRDVCNRLQSLSFTCKAKLILPQ